MNQAKYEDKTYRPPFPSPLSFFSFSLSDSAAQSPMLLTLISTFLSLVYSDSWKKRVFNVVFSLFPYSLLLTLALCLCASVPLCLLYNSSVYAYSANHQRPKMIVVIADKLSFQNRMEFDLPAFNYLIKHGAIGLMNTRTIGRVSSIAAYTTIGAGMRANGREATVFAFNANSVYKGLNTGEEYALRIATEPPKEGVVNMGIAQIVNSNAETFYKAVPGLLGETLGANNIKTTVVGNADFLEEIHREISLIAMNTRGLVETGDVSRKNLETDSKFPFGVKTNYKMLEKFVADRFQDVDIIFVETGDTRRVSEFAAFALEEGYRLASQKAQKNLDSFLEFLIKFVDFKTTQILLVSPSPSDFSIENDDTLTPIIVAGRGIKKGLLSSATTKWAGLVANIDISPHILNYFGINTPNGMTGAKFIVKHSTNPVEAVAKFYINDIFIEQNTILLKIIIIVQFFLLAIASLCIMCSSQAALSKWGWCIQLGVLLVSTIDISLLLVAYFKVNVLLWYILSLFAISSILIVLAKILKSVSGIGIFLMLVYILGLAIDQVLGGGLIKNSLLGYYPQGGARFYGLGNEYLGFLISCPIFLVALLSDKAGKFNWKIGVFAGCVFLSILFIVGFPTMGSNVGGLISCCAAFIISLLLFTGRKLNIKTVIVIFLVIGIFISTFLFYDLYFSGNVQSHLGKLVKRIIINASFEEVNAMFIRKFLLNLHLLRVSTWSILLGFLSLSCVFLLYIPFGQAQCPAPTKDLWKNRPYLRKGLSCTLIGAFLGFLLNDSGVLTATTALLLPISLTLLTIQEISSLQKKF